MFGRKPRPPLTTDVRFELEAIGCDLVEALGTEFIRSAEVITDLQQLNLDYSSSERLAQSLRSEIGRRLGMQQANVVIEFDSEPAGLNPPLGGDKAYIGSQKWSPTTASGEESEADGSNVITVPEDYYQDPLRLIWQVTHQFAEHACKLMELPADWRYGALLPVFCGFGVLASAAHLYESNWRSLGWEGWQMSHSSGFNALEVGYTSALFARVRGERYPPWQEALRIDARKVFDKALKWFDARDGEKKPLYFECTTFDDERPETELLEWTHSEDDVFVLAAVTEFGERESMSDEVAERLIELLATSDDAIRVTALYSLRVRALQGPHDPTGRAASKFIKGRKFGEFVASLEILVLLNENLDEALRIARDRIDRGADPGLSELFRVVGGYPNKNMERLLPLVCEYLGRILKSGNDYETDSALACISRLTDDVEAAIHREVRPELIRDDALQAWSELQSEMEKEA